MRNCSQRVSVFALCLLLSFGAQAGVGSDENKIERVETLVESKTIPSSVQYEFSRTVGPGRLKKVQEGKPGVVRRTYQILYREGTRVGKEFLKEERIEPVATVFYMGRAGYQSSRGSFARGRVLTMEATAYDPSPQTIGPGATGRTRTGMIATYGHVAVDPRVIPLGSLVYVEGYGFAIASDTGGAIKGNRIDLCYDSRSTALAFGRKKVRVHILKRR